MEKSWHCVLNFCGNPELYFFKVKHKKEPALASRVKDERWSVYSFKRGMQQLPNRLKEEASQRKEAELLRDTPCSPLQWKDGKFLVRLFVLILKISPRQHFFSHVGTGLPVLNQY